MLFRFARNAAFALCALGTAGCGTFDWLDGPAPVKAQIAPPAADADAALPTTLEGEIARAHELRVKGQYAEAARALGQLLLVAPDNSQVVGEYGKVLTQEGRPQDALAFIKRAIELRGDDWTLYSVLGVVYDQLDDHAQARIAYEHALVLAPDSAEILNNYGLSRLLAGDLDGAKRLFAQASAANSQNVKIANNVAMLSNMKHPAQETAPPARTPPRHAVATAETPAAAPLGPAVQQTASIQPSAAPVATNAPRVLSQKVPLDPLAGPVARFAAPAVKQASVRTAKVKPVKFQPKPAVLPPPPLRTAADGP